MEWKRLARTSNLAALVLTRFAGTANASAYFLAQASVSGGSFCAQEGSTAVAVDCSESYTPRPAVTISYGPRAATSLFSLHAASTTQILADSSENASISDWALSQMMDYLTVSGALSSGILRLALDVDSNIVASTALEPNPGPASASTSASLLVETNFGTNQVFVFDGSSQVFSGRFLVDIPSSGVTPDLQLRLQTSAACSATETGVPGTIQECTAISDSYDTVTLSGVEVLDASGNLLPNVASGGTASYYAYAYTSLFSMHADAEVRFTAEGSYLMNIRGGAESTMFDVLTLSGAPSTGFPRFDFGVNGSVVSNATGGATSYAAPLLYIETNDGTYQLPVISVSSSVYSGEFTADIPYLGFNPDLQIYLSMNDTCQIEGGGEICTAITNYSDTVTVAGVGVLDANGNLVPGATIESSSGVFYPRLKQRHSGAGVCFPGGSHPCRHRHHQNSNQEGVTSMKTFALALCLLNIPGIVAAAGHCSDIPVAFTISSTYADPTTGIQYTSAIQPDAGGDYVDGVNNVIALIHVCNGSNAVTVNANGGPRTLTYNFQNVVNRTSLTPSWTSSPVTTSNTFVSFSDIMYNYSANSMYSFTTYMNELYLPNEPGGPYYVSMENKAAVAPASKISSDATPCANSIVNVVHYPAVSSPSAPEHWVVWADGSQPQGCNGGNFLQVASMVTHSKGHTNDDGEFSLPFYMVVRKLQ